MSETAEQARQRRDQAFLDAPEADRIWLVPKCEGLSYEGRHWCEDRPEDCQDCGMKPVEYIRAGKVAEIHSALRTLMENVYARPDFQSLLGWKERADYEAARNILNSYI